MTQTRRPPTVKRRRVGAQLRRWRGSMKSGDAARLLGWDGPHLSRVERGVYRVSREEVREMARTYGIEDAEAVEEVARVAEEPPGGGWWAPYAGRIPPDYLDFIELEADSRAISIQHPTVIPGLLQSPGYVREMITRAPISVSPQQAEVRVNIRLARQEILTREEPVKIHALLPESALHARFASGPAIMRDQLRRLLDIADMANVTLQVTPLTAHPTFSASGAVTLLAFRHPWTPVASIDNPLGGGHTEDPQQVAILQTEFDGVTGIAYPVDESRHVIEKHLEGLG
jgi:hypothetical protein